MKLRIGSLIFAFALAGTACSSDGTVSAPDSLSDADTEASTDDTTTEGSGSQSGASAAYESFQALPVACEGTAPEPPESKQYDEAEDQGIEDSQTVTATITTSCGDLTLELNPEAAPNTVNNFVFLAREGFYNGVVSHRIAPGFVLQVGDPTATGGGGPGYKFDDELPAESAEYVKGAVVMANSGPDTNGSQIFINFVDTPGLPAQYSKFGQLTGGEDVLAKIEQIPATGPNGDTPTQALYIESVTVDVT